MAHPTNVYCRFSDDGLMGVTIIVYDDFSYQVLPATAGISGKAKDEIAMRKRIEDAFNHYVKYNSINRQITALKKLIS